MNKNLKERAITLIALVITIVVLIILATVVINLSLGENGLFSRAREAKELYLNAQENEKIQISEFTNSIEHTAFSRGNYTEEQIRAIMQEEIQRSLSNMSLDYDHKVDIKDYNTASNKYTVPGFGIVTATSILSASGRMNTIHINDQWYYIAGGVSSGFSNGAAYSQVVSAGDTVYFVTDGGVSFTPTRAFFIPFQYTIPTTE